MTTHGKVRTQTLTIRLHGHGIYRKQAKGVLFLHASPDKSGVRL